MPKAYTFSKPQRLLTPAEFKLVLSSSIKLVSGNFVLYAKADEQARLGLGIAKKHAKKAVQRNTIKRIIRESFRLKAQQLPAVASVIISRPSVVKADKIALRRDIDKLWQQLQIKFPKALSEA